jgi:lysozyme
MAVTSLNGIRLLKRHEGLRLKAYQDGGGVWTIGYGHTSMAGPPTVTRGLTITEAQAESILRRDLSKYEAAVNRAIKVPIRQNQFDALVSLCYNIGPGAFASSSVVRKLNAGDHIGAAKSFMNFNKDNGRVVSGLTRRRREEMNLFLGTHDFEPKPALKHRRVKMGLLGIGGGYATGAIGMFAGFDWMALLILLGFISFWALVFYFVYRDEIEDGLFGEKEE